ncbi:Hypothetical protein D9617_21g096350 [Elsinoe fawcettii]|nr:Hypothetical protein D9617_21g096350 [Elsinoe fawcettii]
MVSQRPAGSEHDRMSTDATTNIPQVSPLPPTASPRDAPEGPESYVSSALSANPSTVSHHSDKQALDQERELSAPMLALEERDQDGKIFYQDPSHAPERVIYQPYPGGNAQAAAASPTADESAAEKGTFADSPRPEERYICGIQRTKFIIIACIFAAVVIGLAVGIGVSQGTKKSNTDTSTVDIHNGDNSANTNKAPLAVLSNTGIASTPRADGAGMLLYYQAPNGSVIEEYYVGNTLTANSVKKAGPAATQRNVVVTPNIAPEAPLAAVAYQLNGSDWRHIFYVTNGGIVMEMKSSDTTWTTPQRVFVNGIAPGGKCLAACFGPVEKGIGLRLIAGLAAGNVLMSTHFLNQTGINGWKRGLEFGKSTLTAGCACNVDSRGDNPRLHIYTRNDTDAGNVLHNARTFPNGNWTQINENAILDAPDMAMDKASSMTVTNSANGTTNWVFYQGTDGRMKQFLVNSQTNTASNAFNSWDTSILSGSKMAATWLNTSAEGPMVLYQTNSEQIRTSVVNWNAVALANDTLRA